MFKKLKFEKSKYPIFKFAFWIIFISSILMIAIIAKKNYHFFEIKENYAKNPVVFNISFNRKIDDNYLVCFGSYCKALQENSAIGSLSGLANVQNASFDIDDENFGKIDYENIYLAIPENDKKFKNVVDDINIFIGKNYHHFNVSDVLKFNSKVVSIVLDNSKEAKEYKVFAFSELNSKVEFKDKIKVAFLSLVFNYKCYIVPYIWLSICLLIFIFNKDAFKISIKNKFKILFALLFVLIFLLFSAYLLLDNKSNDELLEYIKKDLANYKNYETHIISNKNKDYLKEYFKNENSKIIFHYVDKDEKLTKIEKDDYKKDKKNIVIYFDSDSVEIETASILSARMNVINTNSKKLGKITY